VKRFFFALLSFTLVTFPFNFCFSGERFFRCGNKIVKIGERASGVKFACGPPTNIEAVAGGGAQRSSESWVYNCGDNGFNYVLHFYSGVLCEIERLDQRGSGLPDWLRNNVPQ
jgi:hypothetical protein